jgi:hypothetical protein
MHGNDKITVITSNFPGHEKYLFLNKEKGTPKNFSKYFF